MQGTTEKIFSLDREACSLLCLSLYIVLSFTHLPALAVLVPLVISGLFLLNLPAPVSLRGVINKTPALGLAVILFLVCYLTSVLASANLLRSLNALLVLFPGLLVAYCLAQQRSGQTGFVAWCLMFGVASVSCLVTLMFVESNFAIARLTFQEFRTPALVVPNDVLAAVIFSPVVLGVCLHGRPGEKWFAVYTLLTLVLAVYLSESRVACLTMVFMLLLFLYFRYRRSFPAYALLALVLFYCVDTLFALGVIDNLLLLRIENARLGIWLAGLKSWTDFPWLGFGPGNFEMAYESGASKLSLPDWALVDSRRISWAHSLYLESLVERGLLGFISQGLLLVVIFGQLLRKTGPLLNASNSFHFYCFIAFSGFLFAGLFEPTMQRIWTANTLFIFIGLALVPGGGVARPRMPVISAAFSWVAVGICSWLCAGVLLYQAS